MSTGSGEDVRCWRYLITTLGHQPAPGDGLEDIPTLPTPKSARQGKTLKCLAHRDTGTINKVSSIMMALPRPSPWGSEEQSGALLISAYQSVPWKSGRSPNFVELCLDFLMNFDLFSQSSLLVSET
ncbi:hypothetical protein RRG08_025105 [Elysia crispata]|uniref:Uncharacterized protein n=1 Tax=Elysia crispata TaxID=231223 RepID=A0AAE1AJ01_9GAST|nr:hypothetical protein RRG08_025105 [Elysia crispata]